MARSEIIFDRWDHTQSTTWPFQVYKKYNEELSNFIWANDPVHGYVISTLSSSGAEFTDSPLKYFKFSKPNHNFQDIKAWSSSNKQLNKWLLLNSIMALSSNFETYLSSVISLSIESDPGILLGASKSIDGTILLKKQPLSKQVYENKIESCTKGTWGTRLAGFRNLFGTAPQIMIDEIGSLDKIRNIRNNVGHAFGRDIKEAHNFVVNKIRPMETIGLDRVIKYLKITYDVAKSIDSYLLNNHIGEFQTILAYHDLYQRLDKNIHITNRANSFKKHYGPIDSLVGKKFCKGLACYYESI